MFYVLDVSSNVCHNFSFMLSRKWAVNIDAISFYLGYKFVWRCWRISRYRQHEVQVRMLPIFKHFEYSYIRKRNIICLANQISWLEVHYWIFGMTLKTIGTLLFLYLTIVIYILKGHNSLNIYRFSLFFLYLICRNILSILENINSQFCYTQIIQIIISP